MLIDYTIILPLPNKLLILFGYKVSPFSYHYIDSLYFNQANKQSPKLNNKFTTFSRNSIKILIIYF